MVLQPSPEKMVGTRAQKDADMEELKQQNWRQLTSKQQRFADLHLVKKRTNYIDNLKKIQRTIVYK